MGGRVRVMITGSAPIADSVKDFLSVVFCCPIVEVRAHTHTYGVMWGARTHPYGVMCGVPAGVRPD